MKRPILFVILILVAAALFATGGQESAAEVKKLYVVASRGDVEPVMLTDLFHKTYPGVELEFLRPKLEDGSTVTMDSRLMSGQETNVLAEYMGRIGKYAAMEDISLDLGPYIKDKADFLPGKLEMTTYNGRLAALPMTGGAFGMAVNLRMLDEIGFGDFDFTDWSLGDFERMAEAVKRTYNGEKWVTGLFFGHRSGDYLWMQWLSTFGAKMYGNGYDTTTINSQAGINVFTFWKTMHERGYVRPDCAVLLDDDYLGDMGTGKYLMTAYVPGWLNRDQKAADAQGIKDAYYPFKFVQFPKAEGVDKVPAAGSCGGVMAFQNESTLKEDMSAHIAWLWTTEVFQNRSISYGEYPTRKSVTATFDSPYWGQINKIVADNGMLDLGISKWFFADVRVLAFPIAQAVITGKLTPAQGAAKYAADVNKVLAK